MRPLTDEVGAAAEALVATEAGLAPVLRTAVMRLRRRLAVERDPENPLSLAATAVLMAIQSAGGETTFGQLAARERVQPPTMTRIVNLLEESGLVSRRAADDDRRTVRVALTEQGLALVRSGRLHRDEWLAERLASLSPAERDVLRSAIPLLDRMCAG